MIPPPEYPLICTSVGMCSVVILFRLFLVANMEAPLANPTKTATLAQAVFGHTAPIGSKVAVIFSSKTRNTTGCEKTCVFFCQVAILNLPVMTGYCMGESPYSYTKPAF